MFIDSSKRSLKCVLLHNGNLFGAVPVGHSVCLRKEHGDVKRVIELLQYDKHSWIICVDLKMVCFLLGQQRGCTKYPCFLCMCDSRALEKHWVRRIGLQNLILNLEILTFYMSHFLIERKLCSHLYT